MRTERCSSAHLRKVLVVIIRELDFVCISPTPRTIWCGTFRARQLCFVAASILCTHIVGVHRPIMLLAFSYLHESVAHIYKTGS